MAHIESGGSGRKTSLELNLVPFIDLMSVLITFLLITAVWSQVSMIQIGSSIYGQKSADSQPTKTPDIEVVLKVDIRATGYVVTVGKDTTQIPQVNGHDYNDEQLAQILQEVKQKYPGKLDGAIAMSDELPYEQLIHVMDSYLKTGFPQISVLTGGPN